MQAPEDDTFLARYVLEQNLVAREALLECLYQLAQERKAGGFAKPLGVILRDRGLLTDDDLNRVFAARANPTMAVENVSETEIGKLLVAAGIMCQEDVDRCVQQQETLRTTGKGHVGLGELIVKAGYATEQQILRVLAYQKKLLLTCNGCGVRVSAASAPGGIRYRCKKCGGTLVEVEASSREFAWGARSLREAAGDGRPQLEIDRAVTAYLRQKEMVPPEHLRESEHLQVEFARYGLVVPLAELLRRAGHITWAQQGEFERVDFEKLESIVQMTKDELPADVIAARANQARIFGKYVLLDELGTGGAGVVQKAWDTMIGEYVALKFIREHRDSGATREEVVRQRKSQIMDLLQEARAALRLRHDHIVAIRDVGRINGQFYISMEYIEGNTLGEHIRATQSRGRLSPLYEDPVFYLTVLLDVCNAIQYAHTFARPIVHCDLKPGNVLISVNGVAYVMDFGLARMMNVRQEDTGVARGTPAYMAPEQLSGKPEEIGVWTDVYGIGAILYELLTGRAVFTGETPDVLTSTMHDPPQRPSEIIRATTEGKRHDTTRILARLSKLEAVCLRCLAKKPSDRYQNVRDIAEDLELALAQLQRQDGADSRIVPRKLLEARVEAEFRRVEDQMVGLNLDVVQREVARLKLRALDGRQKHWAERREDEARVLEQFLDRLAHLLSEQRPRLTAVHIVEGVLKEVEVLKATAHKIVVFHADRPVELVWSSLLPSQIVALAETVKMAEPEDRLALGIFCKHAHMTETAERFLSSLVGTSFEGAAKQALAKE